MESLATPQTVSKLESASVWIEKCEISPMSGGEGFPEPFLIRDFCNFMFFQSANAIQC